MDTYRLRCKPLFIVRSDPWRRGTQSFGDYTACILPLCFSIHYFPWPPFLLPLYPHPLFLLFFPFLLSSGAPQGLVACSYPWAKRVCDRRMGWRIASQCNSNCAVTTRSGATHNNHVTTRCAHVRQQLLQVPRVLFTHDRSSPKGMRKNWRDRFFLIYLLFYEFIRYIEGNKKNRM